jgi:hypothetical protein
MPFWFEPQLFLKCQTRYFLIGTPIADSRDVANGLMLIAAGSVGMELPLDSSEADVRTMPARPLKSSFVWPRVYFQYPLPIYLLNS